MVSITGGGGGGAGYDYVQDSDPTINNDVEVGAQWFDTGTGTAKIYDGESWNSLAITDHSELSGVTADNHHQKPTETQKDDMPVAYGGGTVTYGSTSTFSFNSVDFGAVKITISRSWEDGTADLVLDAGSETVTERVTAPSGSKTIYEPSMRLPLEGVKITNDLFDENFNVDIYVYAPGWNHKHNL